MIFESHAHYDDWQFKEDQAELLKALPSENVGIVVNIGANIESTRDSIQLAETYNYIYVAAGVHPDEVDCLEEQGMEYLEEVMSHEKVVAVGEIGLDYYRKEGDSYKEIQKKWFLAQLELAAKNRKPVVVHSRDAAEDTLKILKEFYGNHKDITNPGVIHCFSYSKEMAKEYINMGFYIGVGGVVTFKNGKKLVRTVEEIPLERILVETDSPYLSPEPNRGKRNDSRNIKYIIEKIAEIKGISPEEVEQQTEMNARNMYGIR